MKHVMQAAFTVLMLAGLTLQADIETFGSGANEFTMDFATIGNAGNAADSNGRGTVNENYRIAKYEVTIEQFTKARAADSNISNGNEDYWQAAGTTAPATRISWYEAAKYCNWLTSGNALQGAYLFSDADTFTGIDRASAISTYGTVYVLPTENEWYKAAYFKPDASGYSLYANGTDTAPGPTDARYNETSPWTAGSGTMEQNGTFDMMGNVWEWLETESDIEPLEPGYRLGRGGSYDFGTDAMRSVARYDDAPGGEAISRGFRVAAVPEPAVASLLILSATCLLAVRRFLGIKDTPKSPVLPSVSDPF